MPLGIVIGSGLPPESLGLAARQAEEAGFDEVWVSEDFFFTGGIAGAAIALGATERVRVGLGVVSALVRHPALLAMELATLARAYPGRFTPGIGLGVPAWMDQMGLLPESPLGAVRECLTILRGLLEGDEVDHDGRLFSLRGARLTHAPAQRLPIELGVIGPRLLRLSGALADGTVLSVLAGDEYVRYAREAIEAGRREAGRSDPHRVTVLAIYSVSPDGAAARAAAREALAFYAAAGGTNALTDAAGISASLSALLRGGTAAVRESMPADWVERLTVSGDPDDVVARIRGLHAAGADAVALFPVPADRLEELVEVTAAEVIPRL